MEISIYKWMIWGYGLQTPIFPMPQLFPGHPAEAHAAAAGQTGHADQAQAPHSAQGTAGGGGAAAAAAAHGAVVASFVSFGGKT